MLVHCLSTELYFIKYNLIFSSAKSRLIVIAGLWWKISTHVVGLLSSCWKLKYNWTSFFFSSKSSVDGDFWWKSSTHVLPLKLLLQIVTCAGLPLPLPEIASPSPWDCLSLSPWDCLSLPLSVSLAIPILLVYREWKI